VKFFSEPDARKILKAFSEWKNEFLASNSDISNQFFLLLRSYTKREIRVLDKTVIRLLTDGNYSPKASVVLSIAKATNTEIDLWAPGGNLDERRQAVSQWRPNLIKDGQNN
jgi:hypothetical protein